SPATSTNARPPSAARPPAIRTPPPAASASGPNAEIAASRPRGGDRCIAASKNSLLRETLLEEDAYLESRQHAGFVPREAFNEGNFDHCCSVLCSRFVTRIRGDDDMYVRQHDEDHHDDEFDAGWPGQGGDGQGDGHGQRGHEQRQHARWLQALHDGPEGRHDEVASGDAALRRAAFERRGFFMPLTFASAISACRDGCESGYIAAIMSSADKSRPLTRLEARRIWLRAQRLDTSAPFGAGPAATTAAVEHLGSVQIDTINVIERSHHHVLWTRIPDYRRADLRQAQSTDKTVFEYWTHALSYVPTRDIRFFIPAMK